MLANYKLYWCPKSNKLFIPGYDTEPVTAGNTTEFIIEKFRPLQGCKIDHYSWFEAIHMVSFGTWGLMGHSNESIIKCLTDPKCRAFDSEYMADKLKEFIIKFPQFKEVTFATADDCVKGNIPKTAVVAKAKASKSKKRTKKHE